MARRSTATIKNISDSFAAVPTLRESYWEEVFVEADPWDYETSEYETWKFAETLSLLPAGPIGRAVEIGCAEGHLATRLAARVDRLTAIDISPTAIARARARCAEQSQVEFRVGNLVETELPQNSDLVLCSEMLFYLPLDLLRSAACRIAASLKVGGHLLLCHGNLVSDELDRTGFDWGHPFGARTIGSVFAALDGLEMVRQRRSPLFTVQLFRRRDRRAAPDVSPLSEDVPIPFNLALTPRLEKTIIWDGAVITREEAKTRETANRVPILMYHSVADQGPAELAPYRMPVAKFAEQLRYLRRHGYYSITVAEWARCIREKRSLPGRPIILTFDDGYEDFLDNAWPLLERSDFTATLFVVTEKVGTSADWDELASAPLKLLGWDAVRKLADAGVEIGSHSASHKDFLTLTSEQVFDEGIRARDGLRASLGAEIDIIAFPWGRSDPAGREALRRGGYSVGLTTEGGASTLTDDPLHLPRIEVFGSDDIETFAKRLVPGPAQPWSDALPMSEWTGVPLVEPANEDQPEMQNSHRDHIPLNSNEVVGFDEGATPSQAPVERARLRTVVSSEPTDFRGDAPPAPFGAAAPQIRPAPAVSLASRLDALIGEFVSLQNQLLNASGATPTLPQRLAKLFAQPITGTMRRILEPGAQLAPGVRVCFDPGADVQLTIEPKPDHSTSPESHLNTIELDFRGPSGWLAFEFALEWADILAAERFQLSLYARTDRVVACSATLCLPSKSGHTIDADLANFTLHPGDRHAAPSGAVAIPDFIELNTRERPRLLLSFDPSADLNVILNYFNIYFA